MGSENKNERVLVDVWDVPTRVLHWINFGLIITLILLMLGNEGMEVLGVEKSLREPVNVLHALVGYVLIVTFSLRLVWCFIGNRYARWGDLVPSRASAWRSIGRNLRWYLSGFKGSPARATGHDPLASLFYLVLFIVIGVQAVTGIFLAGAELNLFPGTLFVGGMSGEVLEEFAGALEEVHEAGYFIVLFFIAAHLVGLVVHEIKEKNGLFSSMINGRKYLPADEDL